MTDGTPIDALYEDAKATITTLEQNAEISLQVSAGDHFRKVLLLAAASYFEHCVCDSVVEFVREQSEGSTLLVSFVRNKAIARQYHTWFTWDGTNANNFFGLFGDDFRTEMSEKVKKSNELRASVQAFLELGNERNKLIHQNYATFALEKDLEEIYQLYRRGLIFVQQLAGSLRDCEARLRPKP